MTEREAAFFKRELKKARLGGRLRYRVNRVRVKLANLLLGDDLMVIKKVTPQGFDEWHFVNHKRRTFFFRARLEQDQTMGNRYYVIKGPSSPR